MESSNAWGWRSLQGHLVPTPLSWQGHQPSTHLCGSPLDWLQQVHVFPEPRPTELDAPLQLGYHQCQAQRQNHSPQPAGHTAFHAAQDTWVFIHGVLGVVVGVAAPGCDAADVWNFPMGWEVHVATML